VIGERAAPLASARLIARHQIAAAVGTAADFATMVALVELGRLSPPRATILSAIVGGVVNFLLSRGWAFRRDHRGSAFDQALRYASASLGGAVLNAGLLALALRLVFDVGGEAVRIPYVLVRGLVAFVVGVLYTYPVHARFVFRLRAPLEGRPPAVRVR
jgi:putative flippase GtrA